MAKAIPEKAAKIPAVRARLLDLQREALVCHGERGGALGQHRHQPLPGLADGDQHLQGLALDLLDAVGAATATGKDLGADEGKQTYAAIMSLDEAEAKADKELTDALGITRHFDPGIIGVSS